MKVAFLDRDGVINKYPGDKKYVNNKDEFEFIAGSIEAIKKLKKSGFKVFVISNQAGVSKGLYTHRDLEEINDKLQSGLAAQGASVDKIYYCTHHPDCECDCRKPKTGLLEQAISDLGQVPDESFFIGDSFKDLKAAIAFGATPILVLSGRENKACLLYTSPSPRDLSTSRMPSSA